eukprot:7279421-Alexandrium_andersonii.AAC.1
MSASLVGSEMCIRDRRERPPALGRLDSRWPGKDARRAGVAPLPGSARACLLYTSDAADDM